MRSMDPTGMVAPRIAFKGASMDAVIVVVWLVGLLLVVLAAWHWGSSLTSRGCVLIVFALLLLYGVLWVVYELPEGFH